MSIEKLPRLYIDAPLEPGQSTPLDSMQSHYLTHVLRQKDNDCIRVFNGRDGEWLARIGQAGKKSFQLDIERCLRQQPGQKRIVGLYFALIKKSRLDWMIEKAVELGVDTLHPVVTQHCEVRDLNAMRVRQQIVEAAEQCERLTIPELLPVTTLEKLDCQKSVFVCLERRDGLPIVKAIDLNHPVYLMVGPEGGFSESEKTWITKHPEKFTTVSLGERILRAETSAIMALSVISALDQRGAG